MNARKILALLLAMVMVLGLGTMAMAAAPNDKVQVCLLYTSLGLLFLAISAVPFLLVFERRRPQARELVPIAVMSALAVVGLSLIHISTKPT